MPRKSDFEFVVDILSNFTFWICVVLAIVSYYGFRHLANIELISPGMTRDEMIGNFVYVRLVGASQVLQYIAPAACLIAGIRSVFRKVI